MTSGRPTSDYALGSTAAEHERLIRQAASLALLTERLFHEAGIGTGHRVLDLGSGVGDVAMLAARLVGPSGEVVAVERDPRSIARARARMAEAGLHNVTFSESDVSHIASDKPFDAAVGRLILMYLPDPLGVLRSLFPLVRPGGVFAFQEPSWASNLALTAHIPLWHSCTSLIRETFLRSGVNPEMGLHLYWMFQEAGLTPPNVHMEMPVGNDPEWICGVICSLLPRIEQLNLPLQTLGGLDTLAERLRAEVTASRMVAAWMVIVGAWSHRPTNKTSLYL